MTAYKLYGIIVGLIALLIGVVLLFLKTLDAKLTDNELTEKDIKAKRLILAVILIFGGLMSLSAVLLGWPHVRGYIIPPP